MGLRRLGCAGVLGWAMLAGGAHAATGKGGDHWVATWGTASYAVPNDRPPQTTGVVDVVAGEAETIREIAHVSIGGKSVRVALSNEYGTSPLVVGGASVGVAVGLGLRPGSMQPLLFGGMPGISIPAGTLALSDPVALKVEPLSDVAVSIFLPAQPLPVLTAHTNAVQSNLRTVGNALAQDALPGGSPLGSYLFLKNIQVLAPAKAGTIVALGDSITDGAYVTRDSNRRWPDELARRLQADRKTRDLGVVNEGIGGNRVLHNGTGPNALARLGRDALEQPGVRYVIFMEAINDIGNAYQTVNAHDAVTAEELIQGYGQVIERAHEHGIKVFGATLTPYMGAGYSSAAGEQVRVAVNTWIRTSRQFDGVIDFDAATRDPAHPTMFAPALEHGDHLHPGDAGYKVMGDSVDLDLFQ